MKEIASRLGSRIGLRAYRVLTIARRDEPVSPPSGWEVRIASAPEVLHHARDATLELGPAWTREALDRGDRCVVALAAGQLGGYAWLAAAHAPYNDLHWLRVPEGMLYAYKVHVRVEHRGRGLGQALYRFGAAEAARSGCGRLLLLVAQRNVPGIAAAMRAGAQDQGALVLWQSGPRMRVLRTPSQDLPLQFAPFPLSEVATP